MVRRTKLMVRAWPSVVAAVLALCVMTGCSSLGPSTVGRDRFDYIAALSDSWRRQLLLNIVMLRYAETPVFLEVGQVISGYELEGTISANGVIGTKSAPAALGDFVNLGAGGRYLDRPTITYSPLTGPDFIKTMMTPFPPDSVMFLIESGWPVDVVLLMGTQAVNGLRNQKGGVYGHRADPGFIELLGLLHKIQLSGGISMMLEKAKEGEAASSVLLFNTRRHPPEIAQDVLTVRRLLNLGPEAMSIKITYGPEARGENEIALHTRSGFQLLAELAAQVSVPPEHLAEHRTVASLAAGSQEESVLPPLVAVHSGKAQSPDAFVQIKHRDHWYWIDDRDFRSKRSFAFLLMLFTLSESGQKIQPPILTIRAN